MMTTPHNGDTQRKSSVYNQTGESYFEQLSAYNRMSNHLRRILLAQSVVDSRNKKYMREKRPSSGLSNCSKSLDQILARRDIIDGIAYDTVHNPIDLLRMKLGCDPDCRRKSKKRILEERHRSCNVQCRDGSPKVARRSDLNSAKIRHSRTSKSRSPIKLGNCSHGTARSSILTGKTVPRGSKVDETRRKSSNEAGHRISRNNRNDRVLEAMINERYSYDSSFESFSDNSSVDSLENKNCQCPSSSRPHCDTNSDQHATEINRQFDKSELVKRSDEAKYAKFLYDVTQEIMSKGLYRDRELGEVFERHIEANSQTLDRDKMLLEIDQLKGSLNMREFSDDKDNDSDPERSSHPERLGTFSRTKSPNNLNERRPIEKLKNQEKSRRRSSRAPAKNAILLLDTSPEMPITEHEVLVTLMDMKFDPRQVQTICRSLRNNIEASLPPHKDESNSRDRTTRRVVDDAVKKMGECRFREKKTTSGLSATERCVTNSPMRIGQSQTTDDKPEVGIQTSRSVSQQTRGIATSMSLERVAEVATVGTSSRCSEFEKIPATVQAARKDHRARSTSNELQYFEESRDRKSSSPKREENERSESMKNEAIREVGSKTSSSATKQSIVKNGGTDGNSPRPTMQPIEEFDDKIDVIHVTRERKSASSEVNYSDEEVPTTDIVTERGSSPPAPHDQGKRDKTADDELASLPEEYSQMDDSASMLDSEIAEKSRVSSLEPSQPSKLQSIVSESTDDKKSSRPVDESEHEPNQFDPPLDEITPRDARKSNNSEELHGNTPVLVKGSRKNSNYDAEQITNHREKRPTASSVSASPNHDDETRGHDDEISASERSSPREAVESDDKKNDIEEPPGSSDRLRNKRSKTSNNTADERNKSSRRSRAKPSETCAPKICERNSCKRRKKNEPISSLSLGRLIRSSDPESATILEIPATAPGEESEREKRPSGVSVRSESDISLANKADSTDPSITDSAFDNEDAIEDEAKLKREASPWMHQEELALEELAEGLAEAPHRDTINRRTSSLRSARMAVQSLKKRLSTNNRSYSRSSEINVATVISTSTRISRDPPEMPESKEEDSKLTDWSDDTSSSSLEVMVSLQVTIEQGRLSEVSSSDALTSSASEIDRFNEIPRDFAITNRCRHDCPGSRSFWDRPFYRCFCRSNFIQQHSTGRSGHLDSTEHNDKNVN